MPRGFYAHYIKTAELSSKTFSASQGLTNGVFHEQFFPFDPFPPGECIYYDEELERLTKLQTLSLADIHVNMFKAFNNHLINDGCGLSAGVRFCRLSIFPDSRMI